MHLRHTETQPPANVSRGHASRWDEVGKFHSSGLSLSRFAGFHSCLPSHVLLRDKAAKVRSSQELPRSNVGEGWAG